MTGRSRRLGLVLAASLVSAGCASSQAAVPGTPAPAAADPSAEALMICTTETRDDIAEALGLTTIPAGVPTWGDSLYTCTYGLPMGALVLSVKDSPDPGAAADHHMALRRGLPTAEDLLGLGDAAYGTSDGTVGLHKDNGTLLVDATALPAVFGVQDQKRTDFAYEIASVVLGCWTGH